MYGREVPDHLVVQIFNPPNPTPPIGSQFCPKHMARDPRQIYKDSPGKSQPRRAIFFFIGPLGCSHIAEEHLGFDKRVNTTFFSSHFAQPRHQGMEGVCWRSSHRNGFNGTIFVVVSCVVVKFWILRLKNVEGLASSHRCRFGLSYAQHKLS